MVAMTIRGELAFRHDQSRRNLVSGGFGTRTMMQPCASVAKLRSSGPILPVGMTAMSQLGIPPPRIVIGNPPPACGRRNLCLPRVTYWAGRMMIPSGTNPSRTKRHNAIRSLRANATIIVLRVLGAFSVRVRNHCAKALSFWNIRNRQANWIIPRLTRALPERASPFSRRLFPLSSGEPVRPA